MTAHKEYKTNLDHIRSIR